MLIKSITSQADYENVVRLEREDNHEMSPPTHMVLNDKGEIIGALSIIPTVAVWMDTKKNDVRSSVKMEQQLTTFFSMKGEKLLMLPCKKTSPYNQYLTKLGYVKVEDFDLFFKPL